MSNQTAIVQREQQVAAGDQSSVITHSEQVHELATALAKAQAAMAPAVKDSANPYFRSKYADLASVWEACRIPLSSNGLSVVQVPSGDGRKVIVTTMLMHTSGQWIRGELQMIPMKNDPQGIGSCITYSRRYSLAAMVGVAPEDDDGEVASQSRAQSREDREETARSNVARAIEQRQPQDDSTSILDEKSTKSDEAWGDVVCHIGTAQGPVLGRKLGELLGPEASSKRVEKLLSWFEGALLAPISEQDKKLAGAVVEARKAFESRQPATQPDILTSSDSIPETKPVRLAVATLSSGPVVLTPGVADEPKEEEKKEPKDKVNSWRLVRVHIQSKIKDQMLGNLTPNVIGAVREQIVPKAGDSLEDRRFVAAVALACEECCIGRDHAAVVQVVKDKVSDLLVTEETFLKHMDDWGITDPPLGAKKLADVDDFNLRDFLRIWPDLKQRLQAAYGPKDKEPKKGTKK